MRTLSSSLSESKKATVVLIHGVGDTRAGEMSRDVGKAIRELNVNVDAEFREFVWNEFVEKPSDDP